MLLRGNQPLLYSMVKKQQLNSCIIGSSCRISPRPETERPLKRGCSRYQPHQRLSYWKHSVHSARLQTTTTMNPMLEWTTMVSNSTVKINMIYKRNRKTNHMQQDTARCLSHFHNASEFKDVNSFWMRAKLWKRIPQFNFDNESFNIKPPIRHLCI